MGLLEKLREEGAPKRSVTLSVRFSQEDLRRLNKAANDIGTTRSKMIYEAVMDLVEQHEREQNRGGE